MHTLLFFFPLLDTHAWAMRSLCHLLLQDLLIHFVVVVAVAVVVVTNGGRHGDSREVGVGFDGLDEILLVQHFICV